MSHDDIFARAPEDHDVYADMAACEALQRSARLSWLVSTETRVRVINPLNPGIWDGVIVGLADHPTLILRTDDGRERALPQAFSVEVIHDEETAS